MAEMAGGDTLYKGTGLAISVDRGSRLRIRVAGEIDLANFGQFVESVRASAPDGAAWILDMSGVTYVDTTAIRALFSLRERFGEMFEVVSNPRLTRILEITGLKEMLRWTEDRA